MCLPQITATQALMALSAGSSFIQFQQQRKAQKDAQRAAIRQNELAKKNALQRYAAEQLKIRQVAKQSSEKGYQATLKARKARAEFTTIAGASGLAISGSTQALLSDFYRTEGNYKASLARNLNINLSQFNRNMEAIQFGQEAQSTYVQPPNSAMLFASAVGNVANTYYSMEMQKENLGLMTNQQKKKYQNQNTVETYA